MEWEETVIITYLGACRLLTRFYRTVAAATLTLDQPEREMKRTKSLEIKLGYFSRDQLFRESFGGIRGPCFLALIMDIDYAGFATRRGCDS